MAIDLIPLLTGVGAPPAEGGIADPPVTGTTQELADWLYDQLNPLSPNPALGSWPSLTYELVRYLVGITVQDEVGMLPRINRIFGMLDVLGPTFEYLAAPTDAEAPGLAETVGSGTGITIPDRFDMLQQQVYRHDRVRELLLDITSPEWSAGVPLGFSGGTHYEEVADMYRVRVLNPEDYRQHQATAGPDRLHRLGWWAETAGTMVGRRDLIEWPDQSLHMNGHRMLGVLIQLPAHINATVTPYNLTF